MTAAGRRLLQPWTGLFVGAVSWYAAHDLAFYLVRPDCRQPWIAPTINLVALLATVAAGFVSWRSPPGRPQLPATPWIGVGAAGLFGLVILWQGIAGLVYSGCER